MSAKPNKSAAFTKDEVEALMAELTPYEDAIVNIETDIAMKGKQLGEAQREQASKAYFYGVRKAELGIILKRLETKVAAIRGRLLRWYKENDRLSSSERQLDRYIDQHDEFLTANEVLLHVEELYKKYCEIESAFEKRGFAIRDFTEARVHEVHRDVI